MLVASVYVNTWIQFWTRKRGYLTDWIHFWQVRCNCKMLSLMRPCIPKAKVAQRVASSAPAEIANNLDVHYLPQLGKA